MNSFSLPDNFHSVPRYQRLLRIGRYFAERAKIELSVREEARIFADEGQIGVADEAGSPIYFDVPITRDEFNRLISGTVAETVALCRQVIQQNGYQSADIARIVMIGGPSRLDGSVRRNKNRVRITTQLVDAATGVQRWAERYDRKLEDVFAIQDEVVRTIASLLIAHVRKAEVERTLLKPPTRWLAHDYFIRGWGIGH